MKIPTLKVSQLVWATILFSGLYLTSLYRYVLFHTLVELFSVGVAIGIFLLAWNARNFLENNFLLFLGIAFLFVAVLDTLHTLAFKGLGVFQGYGANLATQLWISARYLEGLSLFVAPFFLGRRIRYDRLFQIYLVATAVLVFTIFTGIFPQCYAEGSGLTLFKKTSEYIICLILVGSLAILFRRRADLDERVYGLIAASIVATIISELAFTSYVDVFGLSNFIGHYFKIIAFYTVYKAIIETGLTEPYRLLFHEIKEREERIARLNEDLRRHVAQVEEANKELEAFSYSVSHDLRTPLRSISGFSQALAEDYAEKVDAEGRDYLERIVEATKKMGLLIDDLLQLSRMSRAALSKEGLDLSRLAASVAARLRGAHPDRDMEFLIAEDLHDEADRNLLAVVLENLFENACKFTRKRSHAVIEFGRTRLPDGTMPYFVKDNGTGFDMAYAGKLFKPFQRLHRTREFPGTGIGLATVQRIINRHGGRIWIEGEEGKGATVYFTLAGDTP